MKSKNSWLTIIIIFMLLLNTALVGHNYRLMQNEKNAVAAQLTVLSESMGLKDVKIKFANNNQDKPYSVTIYTSNFDQIFPYDQMAQAQAKLIYDEQKVFILAIYAGESRYEIYTGAENTYIFKDKERVCVL